MTMQKSIHDDLRQSMKEKNDAKTSALRVLVGEFQRQAKKELSDTEVLAIIKKLIKSEMETIAMARLTETDYLRILKGYLPQEAGEDEIREWIRSNIDFGRFKNKMQAMKPIMAHFGGSVDGNMVKKILEGL
ncbi:MAG: GatB/YqeY domain-containing protein [Fibrobacterota bacterium]